MCLRQWHHWHQCVRRAFVQSTRCQRGSSRRPPFSSLRFDLKDQNICIGSPLPPPNNLDLSISSTSAWQVTPTIPTFIPIRLSLEACPTHMVEQTHGYETSLRLCTVLRSMKRQVSYCTSAISTNADIQTYSTASGGLDLPSQSTLVRGHGEGAGISHTDNVGPPACRFLIIPGHSDLT